MIAAFFIGLGGGVHCAAMCGPLNFSLAGTSLRSFTIYHIGRLLVYGFIGLFFGLLGESFAFFRMQHVLTVISGVLLLLVYAVPAFRAWIEKAYYQSKFYGLIKGRLTRGFHTSSRWFFAGVLNGFIPCALVYLAATGSLLAADFWSSVLYMQLFALGTIPSLFITVFAGSKLVQWIKSPVQWVTPLGVAAGVLLIFRSVYVSVPNLDALIREHFTGIISTCGF